MINKELGEIMKEYINKVNDFCKNYEKSIIEKDYSPFSRKMEVIFENLKNELWRLKHNAEEFMYISNDRMITCEINNRNNNGVISLDVERVRKELDEVHKDLNTMHTYYIHRYAANIVNGLAEKWKDKANEAAFDIMKSAVKSMMKAGAENDN